MLLNGILKRSFASSNASVALLKASAFTGSPSYYEALYFLDDILIRTAPIRLQSVTSITTNSRNLSQQIKYTWKSRQKLSEALQFPLTALQFRRIRQRLNAISEVAHKLEDVREFLKPFVAMESVNRVKIGEDGREIVVSSDRKQLAVMDEKGRMVANGKRKEAKALIHLTKVPETLDEQDEKKKSHSTMQINTIMVNNKPFSTYFMRIRDRIEVCKPFEVTDTFGKYYMNCSVEGGGHTGQAGAIRFALSKALASIDPTLQPILGKEGLLKRDIRRVERKKYGQEKARKKFTWYILSCSLVF